MDEDRQCTATAKSTGERCQRAAIKGGSVCHVHGGATPQVKQKAQERLDEMADSVTADMQEIIEDFAAMYEVAPPEDKAEILSELRKSWKIVLDRTGHGPTDKRQLEDVSEDGKGFGTTIVLDSEYVDDE